jgi:hypothetical protein
MPSPSYCAEVAPPAFFKVDYSVGLRGKWSSGVTGSGRASASGVHLQVLMRLRVTLRGLDGTRWGFSSLLGRLVLSLSFLDLPSSSLCYSIGCGCSLETASQPLLPFS